MSDVNLQSLANISAILGAFSFVVALIFSAFQIREFKMRRRDIVAVGLMQSFYSADFAHAVALLRLLPDAVPAATLRQRGPEYEEAAILVTTTFETMGLMVHRGIAPFSLVEELAGGVTVVMRRKLCLWLETVSDEQNQPSWGEWFRWLGEQLQAVEGREEPAHLKFKAAHRWQPFNTSLAG